MDQIIIYRAQDGDTEVQVTTDGETVWLTQAQMSELFRTSSQNITLHLKNIYGEGELSEEATCKESLQVRQEGNRSVQRVVKVYNLDVIISVGYRVKSVVGTHFRIWATQQLREFLTKGFIVDDDRLAGKKTDYFDELVERVRSIRTSERNFYQKVTDIFALSVDYDSKSDLAHRFFALVQNKFHYAIHGHTAAELIVGRVDSKKPNMGLQTWKGTVITSEDAKIAKNYLEVTELKRLELLVEQFLSFAELRSMERTPMHMTDWVQKLDGFLRLNDKAILQGPGVVKRTDMEKKVRDELAAYNKRILAERKIIDQPKPAKAPAKKLPE